MGDVGAWRPQVASCSVCQSQLPNDETDLLHAGDFRRCKRCAKGSKIPGHAVGANTPAGLIQPILTNGSKIPGHALGANTPAGLIQPILANASKMSAHAGAVPAGSANAGLMQAVVDTKDSDDDSFSKLGQDVRARLAECGRSADDLSLLEQCVKELDAIVRESGTDWQLQPFGSLANGFCTQTSDLDATCFREVDARDNRNAAHTLRHNYLPLLEEHRKFEVVQQVLQARIPILKLRFNERLDVDLSCNNTQPLRNTWLLKSYCQLHASVRDLGVAVKLWTKAVGVVGAAQWNLSSYAFNLLVIYFMQVDPEIQLPCLPIDAFEFGALRDLDPRVQAAFRWVCPLSLGQLVQRFFFFFAKVFDWGREVAAVRLGRRTESADPIFRELPGRWTRRIHVEDPFEQERNLHCVLGPEEEIKLRTVFRQALASVNRGATPAGMYPIGRGDLTQQNIEQQIQSPQRATGQETTGQRHAEVAPVSPTLAVNIPPFRMPFVMAARASSGADSVPAPESSQSASSCLTPSQNGAVQSEKNKPEASTASVDPGGGTESPSNRTCDDTPGAESCAAGTLAGRNSLGTQNGETFGHNGNLITSRTEPRIVEPRVVEPRVVEPRVVEPRVVEPRIVAPRFGALFPSPPKQTHASTTATNNGSASGFSNASSGMRALTNHVTLDNGSGATVDQVMMQTNRFWPANAAEATWSANAPQTKGGSERETPSMILTRIEDRAQKRNGGKSAEEAGGGRPWWKNMDDSTVAAAVQAASADSSTTAGRAEEAAAQQPQDSRHVRGQQPELLTHEAVMHLDEMRSRVEYRDRLIATARAQGAAAVSPQQQQQPGRGARDPSSFWWRGQQGPPRQQVSMTPLPQGQLFGPPGNPQLQDAQQNLQQQRGRRDVKSIKIACSSAPPPNSVPLPTRLVFAG